MNTPCSPSSLRARVASATARSTSCSGPAAADGAAGVNGLVVLVLDHLARDPVAPLRAVHALGPEVVGLHRVPVAVDDQRVTHTTVSTRSARGPHSKKVGTFS